MTYRTAPLKMPDGPPTGRFKFGGIDLPLPTWAVYALAVLLVAAASSFIYDRYLQGPIDRILQSSEQQRQEREYRRHFGENPVSEEEIFNDERGTLAIAYYQSDRCLLVRRNGRAQWVLNPGDGPPPPDEADLEVVAVTSAGVVPSSVSRDECPHKGECLEKHPGGFDSWHSEKSGCWVKVWRRWEDGCKHYQWYNSCEGNWDSRKVWVCCVH